MARVSFSQYSMWHNCPQQYKLSYIDGLSESSSNIHSVFGSAMHETLQEYLSRCLRISKSQADKGMDTKAFLKEKMREFFLKESNEGKDPICSKEELVEFLEDEFNKLKVETTDNKSNFYKQKKHINKTTKLLLKVEGILLKVDSLDEKSVEELKKLQCEIKKYLE